MEKLEIKKETLLQLADNNSFSEEIIKKEFPQLFEKKETYIKIPLSIITLTDSNKKLGALVRSISANY